MKIIIAGSRNMPLELRHLISEAVTLSGFDVKQVVCGGAKGADTYGKAWAIETCRGVVSFPANWTLYGKSAGAIRNKAMADYADAAIVFIWDQSRGSQNMIDTMKKLGKPVYVVKNGQLPGEMQ